MSIPGFDAAERSFERLRLREAEGLFHDDIAIEKAVDAELEKLLADEGSVEEAIMEQADCIRALLAGTNDTVIVAGIRSLIRSYLDAVAVITIDREQS